MLEGHARLFLVCNCSVGDKFNEGGKLLHVQRIKSEVVPKLCVLLDLGIAGGVARQ